MIILKIKDEQIENIFVKEFCSNKEKFFEFIQNSYDKMKTVYNHKDFSNYFIESQESSMSKTWNNDKDKVWDEL